MIEPTVTTEVGGYRIEWGRENKIIAKVGSIHVHTRGHVTGELTIDGISNDKKITNILIPAQFNFSAPRTRRQEAQALQAKYPDVNWGEIFDQLCKIILRASREGDPPLELLTSENVVKPHFLIDPLILEHLPNVLFGDPGAMKTNFALVLMTILQLPWRDNPLNLRAPGTITRCAYLDWENDSSTLLWQLDTLQRGHELDSLPLTYLKCSRPLASEIERVQQFLSTKHISLIIIDSLGLASGGKLNETESPLEFFAALRKLNVSSLILAHNSKDPESKKKSIYGNQFFTAGARNVWELRKQQEPDSNEAAIALFHQKAPPFCKFHSPIGFKFLFTENSMQLAPADPKNVSEFVEGMTLKTRILEALKSGSKSIEELGNLLDNVSDNTLRHSLMSLKTKNLVIVIERGVYGLPNN